MLVAWARFMRVMHNRSFSFWMVLAISREIPTAIFFLSFFLLLFFLIKIWQGCINIPKPLFFGEMFKSRPNGEFGLGSNIWYFSLLVENEERAPAAERKTHPQQHCVPPNQRRGAETTRQREVGDMR